ncbi:tandem-95 repeat protein [Emcibacter sp.]|uniref:tandem-95 repeat protein n=1 Tax=Emcibacter sp. TaxID=1979954 RepID=UPI003A92D519
MSTGETGTSSSAPFDIELDPALQGAERVKKTERPRVSMGEETDEGTQDTQTRSSIHMGGNHQLTDEELQAGYVDEGSDPLENGEQSGTSPDFDIGASGSEADASGRNLGVQDETVPSDIDDLDITLRSEGVFSSGSSYFDLELDGSDSDGGPAGPALNEANPDSSAGASSLQEGAGVETATLNSAPVAEDDNFDADEDSAVTLDVLGNDNDPEGSRLVITDVELEGSDGAVTHDGQQIIFNPGSAFDHLREGDTETVTISYTVMDSSGATDTATVTLNVVGRNDAPADIALDGNTITENDEGATVGSLSTIDVDATDTHSYSVSDDRFEVQDGVLKLKDGVSLDYETEPNLDITVTATDQSGAQVSKTFEFNVADLDETSSEPPIPEEPVNANNSPDVGIVDLGEMDEDTSITFTAEDLLAQASDLDGDVLAVTEVSVDEAFGMVVDNGDGSWTFSPVENFNGADVKLNFEVTDGIDTVSATASLDVIAVNDAPEVDDQNPVTVSGIEDTAVVISADQLLANASDVDGDVLSVSNIRLEGETDIPVTLKISGDHYDPANVEDVGAGSPEFQIYVNGEPVEVGGETKFRVDAERGDWEYFSFDLPAGTEIESIDVRFVNDAWEGTGDRDHDGVAGEDRNLIVDKINVGGTQDDNGDFTGGVTLEAEDASYARSSDVIDGREVLAWNGSLQFDLSEISPADYSHISSLDHGMLADNGDGTWTINTDQGFSGELTLIYDVVDGNGGVTGATATVSVAEVNDAPVIVTSFDGNSPVSLATNDVVLDAGGTTGRLGDNVTIEGFAPDGSAAVLRPSSNGIGIEGVRFNSQIDFDSSSGKSEQVVLNFDNPVTEINLVTERQIEGEFPGGEQGKWTAYDAQGNEISSGFLTVGDGTRLSGSSVSYDLETGDTPVARVVIEATDVTGKTHGDNSDFTVKTVTYTEVPEVLSDGETLGASVAEGAADGTGVATIAATDEEGDALTYSIAAGNDDGAFVIDPESGKVTVADGSLLDYETEESRTLTVEVSDGKGGTDSVELVVDIENVNETPVAGAVDLGATSEDVAFTFTAEDLLARASDVDGDVLAIIDVAVDPAYGTVTDNGDGTWTFNAVENFSGNDIPFSFDVTDGTETVSSTATLDVTAVVDAPELHLSGALDLDASHGNYAFPEDGIITIDVSYLSVNAGYNNSHGYYIADADGNPIGGAVIQDNVKNGGTKTVTVDTSDYEGGVSLGFFIIPDGDSRNAGLQDETPVTFENINGVWTPVADGQPLTGASTPAYYSNHDLNADGQDHFSDSHSHGNQNWEDLWGGGDGDYTDVNTQVDVVFAPHEQQLVLAEKNIAVDLPQIKTALADQDGSESLSLSISQIPEGAALSDGTNSFVATAGNGTVDVTGWNLDSLQITVAEGTSDFDLSVSATSTENSTGDSNTVTDSVTVTVMENGTPESELYGGNTGDVMIGGDGSEFISSFQGNDSLYGGGGDDILHGGAEHDQLDGGSGNDTLYGGTGNDRLVGGQGNDTLNGNEGHDYFAFGAAEGSDVVSGGAGWTDVIELGGFSGQGAQQGWTLTLEEGDSIQSTDEAAGEMLLNDDAAGTIVFDDGGEITFDGIEKIVW